MNPDVTRQGLAAGFAACRPNSQHRFTSYTAVNVKPDDNLSAQRWVSVLDVLSSDEFDVVSGHYEDRDGKEISMLWRHSADHYPVPAGTDAIAIRESMWVREDDWIEEDIDGILNRLIAVNGLSLEIEDRRESRYLPCPCKMRVTIACTGAGLASF